VSMRPVALNRGFPPAWRRLSKKNRKQKSEGAAFPPRGNVAPSLLQEPLLLLALQMTFAEVGPKPPGNTLLRFMLFAEKIAPRVFRPSFFDRDPLSSHPAFSF
jgi:hypothetical protein